ncbi:hypothetical protein BKA70DRAFT_1435226 [Coprinopsis sp. MPI-PUGE-AT-0042]|nr:hypothetical protein BKA70DRAFT_1435226 [Coprinopsis sp. MPI-PUGE-AT-0042]
MGFAHEFLEVPSLLPSLRELKIGTNDTRSPPTAGVRLDSAANLPPIEILTITRENLAVNVLDHFKLPSLGGHWKHRNTLHLSPYPTRDLGHHLGFVLGGEPFGKDERKVYARLQSVSTSWRRAAATPGLCPGLDIYLDAWAAMWDPWEVSYAKERLARWLAILGPTQAYHLVIKSHGDAEEEGRDGFIRHILTATPSPTNLSFIGDDILPTVLAFKDSHDRVIRLKVELQEVLDRHARLPFLEKVFPNLRTFVVDTVYNLDRPFKHGNLQCLVISDLTMGRADKFLKILSSLPSLRELKIGTEDDNHPDIAGAPLDFPSIEVLAISGENLAVEMLSRFTLPSLKFFGLNAYGVNVPNQGTDLQAYLDFFSRSGLASSTISVIGSTKTLFFASLIENLPPETLLHVNLEYLDKRGGARVFETGPAKEIFSYDFEWLEYGWSGLTRRDGPFNIFIPFQSDAGRGGWPAIQEGAG